MKLTHKVLGVFWILFGLFVIAVCSNSIGSRSSRDIESRQKWKENFSYPTWKGGDYYHDRKIDGEILTEFSIGDYNRTYSKHVFWINLLISKDSPPSKFKLHFGHWGRIEKSSRVKKNSYAKPYALFYTENEITTLSDLRDELEQKFRKTVKFSKNITLLAIKLTHPERNIIEARVCYPAIIGSDPTYEKDEHSHYFLSDSTDIALNLSDSLSIDIVKPLPPMGNVPSKLQHVALDVLGYFLAFFMRGETAFFSWGLIAIIVCHFKLSKNPDAKNKSRTLSKIIICISYIGVIGSLAIYIAFAMAMSAF